MRNYRKTSVCITAGIALLGIIGCVSVDGQAYDQAKRDGTLEAYSNFVARFPDSSFAPVANKQRAVIEELIRKQADEKNKRDSAVAELVDRLQVIVGMSGEDAAKKVSSVLDENTALEDEIGGRFNRAGEASKQYQKAEWFLLVCGITVKFSNGKIIVVENTTPDPNNRHPYGFDSCLKSESSRSLDSIVNLATGERIMTGYSFFGIGRPLNVVR